MVVLRKLSGIKLGEEKSCKESQNISPQFEIHN
jgi:hypothetical protein